MGWLSRDMVDPGLRGAIFGQAVGTRPQPVRTQAGWHVIEIVGRRQPSERAFEDVREDIERYLTFQTVDALLTDLRDAAQIERIEPETITPSAATPGSSEGAQSPDDEVQVEDTP